MSPGRPNAHPGHTPAPTPDPFAPPHPEKSVTRARHPSPAQPHPTPRTSHLFPRLRHFFPPIRPQSRNFATPLEIYAHTCYPRPREGPTPRPGNPTPKRGKAPGIRRCVENWPPATDVPLSSSVTRCHSSVPKYPLWQYRFAQVRRQPQLRGAQNVAERNRFRLLAFAGTTA